MLNLPVLLIKTMLLGRENWERSPPSCWKLNPVLMGSLKESSKIPLWPKLLRGSQTHLEDFKPSPPPKKRSTRNVSRVPKRQADVQGIKVIDKFAKDNAKVLHLKNGGKRFDKRKAETARRKISEWWSKWWDDSCISFLRNSSTVPKIAKAGFLQVVSGVKMLQPEKLTWNQQLKKNAGLVWWFLSFFSGFQLFMFLFLIDLCTYFSWTLNTHEIIFCLRRTTFRISPPKDQVFAQQSGCEMRDVGAVLEACLDSACIEHLAGH